MLSARRVNGSAHRGRNDLGVRQWRPVTVVDIELDADTAEGTAALPGPSLVVARLHTRVLGTVSVECECNSPGAPRVETGTCGTQPLLDLLRHALANEIDRHVERWGCSPASPCPRPTPCAVAREEALSIAPTASVVVATRERPELLRVCVESILRQSHPALEVIVVDNAPASRATEQLVVREPSWQGRVRYVCEEVPGLGRAHNAALPYVRGDVVAITDDDVVVDDHWLASLLEAFILYDAGCVTGPILPLELRTREQSWVEQYGGFARGYRHRLLSLGQPPADDPLFPFTAGRVGSGANMAFTRALLTRIGGFDPALGAGTRARGGDDLAAFATALLSGARIAYTPDAVVRHRHHADYEALQRMAHGYGVGLGAYLTSLVVQKPGVVPALVRRVPGGLRHLLAAGSPKNVGIEPDYPADLIKIERVGVLQGPFRYGLSRLDSRRAARHQTARLAAAAVRTGHHSHAATAVAGSPVANVCEHAHVSSSRSTSTQESR